MNHRHLAVVLLLVEGFLPLGSMGADSPQPLLLFQDLQNTVTQKLDVARSERSIDALKDALQVMKEFTDVSDGVHRWHEPPPPGAFLALQLHALNTALEMQDKTFHPGKAKVGINGRVPWPPKDEIPGQLAREPLWQPGRNPEEYKTANPELYEFYKPLYDENVRQTQIYNREGAIKSIIWDLLRKTRYSLKYATRHRENDEQRYLRYVSLVREIITDTQIQEDILSEESPDYLKQNVYWK